jgi:hypothetical protein
LVSTLLINKPSPHLLRALPQLPHFLPTPPNLSPLLRARQVYSLLDPHGKYILKIPPRDRSTYTLTTSSLFHPSIRDLNPLLCAQHINILLVSPGDHHPRTTLEVLLIAACEFHHPHHHLRPSSPQPLESYTADRIPAWFSSPSTRARPSYLRRSRLSVSPSFSPFTTSAR